MSLYLFIGNLDRKAPVWYNGGMTTNMAKKMTTESYEKYLTREMAIISDRLSLRIYKTDKENIAFIPGTDLRIQIRWDKVRVLDTFLVETSLWYMSNKCKEDQKFMRGWADLKLNMLKNAITKKPKKVKVWAKSSHNPEDHKLKPYEIASLLGKGATKKRKKKPTKKKAGKKDGT
mgnify:FL=1